MLERICGGFRRHFGAEPEVVTRAPGRATLLGAHIDHQGGRVLAAALELSIACAVGPATGSQHEFVALDHDETDRVDRTTLLGAEWRVGGWRDYPRAVLREFLAVDGVAAELAPTRWVFGGNLPAGAGLSSSAALEVSLCLAAERRVGIDLGPIGRARLGRRVENLALGLRSGPMDQLVVALAQPETLLGLDCLALDQPERGPTARVLRAGRPLELVLLDSGVRRRLVGSAFNDRRAEAEQALEVLRRGRGGLAWRDLGLSASGQDLEVQLERLDELPARRARHVLGEDQRAAAGIAAVAAGELGLLRELMSASQASSRELWQCSIPELDLLAEVANDTPGCLGARFSGGGFGGWVAALVERAGDDKASTAALLVERAQRAFATHFGQELVVLRSGLAGGAEAC